MHRPQSLATAAWVLIVNAGFSLLFVPLLFLNPHSGRAAQAMGVPIEWAVFVTLATAGLHLTAGTALLHGLKWGRNFYVGALALAAAHGIFLTTVIRQSPFQASSVLISLAPLLVLGYFFFNRRATAWLEGRPDPEGELFQTMETFRRSQGNENDLARVLAIPAFMFAGGMFLVCLILVGFGMGMTLVDDLPPPPARLSWLMTAILLVPLALSLGAGTAGVFLWGRRRWAATLGWLLLSVGMTAASLHWQAKGLLNNPVFLEGISPNGEPPPGLDEILPSILRITRYISFAGLGIALGGLGLLRRRWLADRDAALAILATDSE